MGIGDWFGKKYEFLPQFVDDVRSALADRRFEDSSQLLKLVELQARWAADEEAEAAKHFGNFAGHHLADLHKRWRMIPDAQKLQEFEKALQVINAEFQAHMRLMEGRWKRGMSR